MERKTKLWERLSNADDIFFRRMDGYKRLPAEARCEKYRKEIRSAETRILAICGDPLKEWIGNRLDSEDKMEQACHYLGHRHYALNNMFALHCSDAEAKRLETLNARLLDLTRDMFARTSRTYRRLLDAPDGVIGGRTCVEGTLRYFGDSEDDVLSLDEDAFYASDFTRMILISAYMDEEHGGDLPVISCHPHILTGESEYRSSMSDRELGLDNSLDDGTSWAESWLHHPKLEHICMCYATHALVTHNNFSVPDFLRLKTFEVKVEIEEFDTVQL